MDSARSLLHTLTNLPWHLPLFLAAILALDACSRPDDRRAHTTAGAWLRQLAPKRAAAIDPPHTDWLVIPTSAHDDRPTRVVPRWADQSEQSAAESAGALYLTLFGPRYHESGFWGVTRATRTLSVLEDPGWTPDQRRSIGQAIDDRLAADGIPDGPPYRLAAQMFRDGVSTTTQTLPGGHIHNALAITLALAFLWSCTLGRPWRSWAAARRDYHLAHNRCPHCKYPVHDYPGTRCPECGHDWADGAPTEN